MAMINPNRELFKWGTIDGRPIYVDPFVQGFIEFPKIMKGTWPDIFGFVKDDLLIFIADYPDLRARGEEIFWKYVYNEKELRKNYRIWEKITRKLAVVEKKVNSKYGLSKLSDAELTKLLTRLNKIHVDFWVYGFLPEISNWGAEKILKEKIIKKHKTGAEEIFERLSAPEQLSFFQTEELELLKIKLAKDRRGQAKMLNNHQKKYYWLRNNYGFTKVLDVNYFKDEMDKISQKDAEKKIKEITDYAKHVKAKKKDVISRYKVSREIVRIADKLSYCVWWQDYRKSFIFKANHIISKFLEEISKRKKIDFKELCYYTSPEIEDLVKNNKKVDAMERFEGFVEYYHEGGGISFIYGPKAVEFATPYITKKVDAGIKELKGMAVSLGDKVSGKVRIITRMNQLQNMEKGEVLVAEMTSPDYIIAMRKASAIITDEGNMTCHAAIVSRELKIPCIVQTKIATKALKDGDLVEVDANKGIIRILR